MITGTTAQLETRPLAELRGISRVYSMGDTELRALNDVSLTILRGEMVAVMGASGSGKSTMLNIMGTLDRPTSGRYLFEGEPVEELDAYELARLRNRKMGFIFQSFNLLARDTAMENVCLPMIYAEMRPSVRRKRALDALEKVGLADRIHRLPTQLSGGQQQRVSIARAIANDPEILLADEPTGALDSATSGQIMNLLCDIHGQGKTVVLVTHNASVAKYAQRLVTFKDGRILSDTGSQ
jgi:putative ABC transport system ATP-binding protein